MSVDASVDVQLPGSGNDSALDARSLNRTAHLAGILYLAMAVLDVLGYMYFPSLFTVPGNAAATVRNILDRELLYRTSILTALAAQIIFILVALTLYHLFRDVDRQLARLMAVLVCVGVAGEMANIANKLTPLALLQADYVSVFSRAQLEALALAALRWGNNLGQLLTLFWGLWLLPFGWLTIKSRFLPRILGYLLLIAGCGYIVSCATFIVFPAQLPAISRFLFPLYFGELPIIFWLAIVGAKVRAAPTA